LEFCAFEERQGREGYGEGGGELREALAAKFFGHEAGDDDGRGLKDDGEEAQPTKKRQRAEADVFEERRERRIGDESPVEMAGVAQELEFIAVEAVAAVGEHVEQAQRRRRWRRG
jgi:hypothetical protein